MQNSQTPIYSFQIGSKPSKVSAQLLSNSQQILTQYAKKQNIDPSSLTFNSRQRSAKLLDGPLQNIKIITLWRLIIDRSTTYKINVFTAVYLIDINSPQLKINRIFMKILPSNQKIRDFVIHPDKRQILIIYENKIQQCILEKEKNSNILDFTLRVQHQHKFNNTMQLFDLRYHPSGQFLIGLKYEQDKLKGITKIQPFKLYTKNFDFIFAQNVNQKCIGQKIGIFLKKNVLSIERNEKNFAIIAGNSNGVCAWNTQNMKIMYYNIQNLVNSTTWKIIQNEPPIIQKDLSPNSFIDGVTYMNSQNNGYFLAMRIPQRHGYRFRIRNNTFKPQDVIHIFSQSLIVNQTYARCIDIDTINSFACVIPEINQIHFTKLNQQLHKTYNLSSIKIPLDHKVQEEGSTMNQYIQDIIYYHPEGELCYLFNLTVSCYKLYTNCVPNRQKLSINQCSNACGTNDPTSYWNQIAMSCLKCPVSINNGSITSNCSCSSAVQTFNPYYGACILQCDKMPFAISDSDYAYHTKCLCKSPQVWFDSYRMCRINCTQILYTDKSVDQSKLAPTQCKCLPNFRYIKRLGGNKQPGICNIVCQNNSLGAFKNNKPYCQCKKDEIWNQNTLKCVTSFGNQNQTHFPKWGIALIILSVLLVIVGVFFLVKKLKSKGVFGKNTHQNNFVGSDTYRTSKRKTDQQVCSDAQMKAVCQVCHKNDTPINCQGPCGHFYHFLCIKQQIDKERVQCPNCFKVFHNGIADLKFVQQKQQMHSIADSG